MSQNNHHHPPSDAPSSNNNSDQHENEFHSLSLAYQTYLSHDKEEQTHCEDVCRSYRQYATFAMCHIQNQQSRLEHLSPRQQRLLPAALTNPTERFQKYKEAAICNQYCLDCILQHAGMRHSQEKKSDQPVPDDKISKVSSVLKSLARDWSAEGAAERNQAYQPLIQAVQRYLPLTSSSSNSHQEGIRICVPGAGVGRLAMELVGLGYQVQGNEFSLFMLLASDFILNSGVGSEGKKQLAISPWLLESRNVHGPYDPCRKVMIPDVDPQSIVYQSDGGETSATGDTTTSTDQPPDFSMAAGDFASIYSEGSQHNQWNAVVCCFFLDAAPNVIAYLEIIYNMLQEDGLLISFGPLLYHWSGPAMRPEDASYEAYQTRFSYLDKRYLSSIDLCWEDIREILLKIGFVIEFEQTGISSLYTADLRSMMNMQYKCVHFVARKKPRAQPHRQEMKEDESDGDVQ